MKSFTFLLLALPLLASAWTPSSAGPRRTAFKSTTKLQVSNGADPSILNTEESADTPCWQDIWSYDCAMSTAYSAAFVPAEWIKKLPCALGLADCDTPEKLNRPAPADGSGVEQVDVMEFLRIKRADPLKKGN